LETTAIEPRKPRHDFLVPAATSLAAFVLIVCFFSPRFFLWSFYDLEPSEHHPAEFNRAIDTLRQLKDPFVRVTNPTNRIISWRLLFPILGHYLHLPDRAFLSLPVVGCLLVLAYVAHLVRRESQSAWAGLAASALAGTASWFFVSSGWLAYFDSWYILGLLVAAFGRSKIASALACLLTPWVDERFLLTLPLVVVVRATYLSEIEGTSPARNRSDALRYLALVAPYCILRVLALATTQDEGSAIHLRSHLATVHNPRQIADALWSGLRALWGFVALGPILLFAKGRPGSSLLLIVTVAGVMVLNVPLAHDLSRSASIMIPAAILGMLLLARARPSLAVWPLAAALAINLLLPARHVTEGWDEVTPLYSLRTEVARLRRPPKQLAALHLTRGKILIAHDRQREALAEVEKAIRIDPTSVAAQINRGFLMNKMGRPAEAASCYDNAVRLAPALADPYVQRAHFRLAIGQVSLAAKDLRTAGNLSPAGSSVRNLLERELAQLERALREP